MWPISVHHVLTHWGWVTHICVSKLTIIGSDNGLSPARRQAIIWTNVGILLIGSLGTNFSEILIEIQTFSFKKMHLKISSAKWQPFCLGLNVLMFPNHLQQYTAYSTAFTNIEHRSYVSNGVSVVSIWEKINLWFYLISFTWQQFLKKYRNLKRISENSTFKITVTSSRVQFVHMIL